MNRQVPPTSHTVSIMAGAWGAIQWGNRAFGPDFVGTHAHPTLTQWYLMLDGSDFIYMAGDEKIPVKAGDVTFTPMGTAHGSLCGAGQQIYYFWFEVNHAWDDDPIEE